MQIHKKILLHYNIRYKEKEYIFLKETGRTPHILEYKNTNLTILLTLQVEKISVSVSAA